METSVPTANHLPPSHGDDVQASRTTLFEGGGDDAAQPNDITMSSIPTHATSTWTTKVNSILSTNPNTSSLDGILSKHLPLYIARCHTTSTDAKGDTEGAQESKPSKAYAWKRRREREGEGEDGARLAGLQPGPQSGRPPARPRPRPRQHKAGLPAEVAGLPPSLNHVGLATL